MSKRNPYGGPVLPVPPDCKSCKKLEKRITELEEKVRQRGQLIAALINIDDLDTSWDRLIVAECVREQNR